MALAGTRARAIVLVALLSCLIGPAAARATTVQVAHFSTSATDTGAGADGVVGPGDTVNIGETVLSSEPTTLTNAHGTLSATTPGVTVGTPGPLAYPDIAFGDTGTNTTPFTATLPGSLACGQNVGFSLGLSSAQGTATVPFSVGTGLAGAPVSYDSTDVPNAIPDASGPQQPGVLESSLEISQPGRVKNIRVRLGQLTHQYDGDLRISLVAPDGTSVVLVDQRGVDGQNFTNTVITADQGAPIAGGTAPFTGTFKADGDLTQFVGKDEQGTWKLRVEDLSQGGTGYLQSWGIDISSATCAAQPIASFTATPNPVAPGGSVDFDASASSDPVGTIVDYSWDLDGNGTYETDTGPSPTVSQLYPTHGAVPVGLLITDDHGRTRTATVTVSVTSPPTASFIASPTSPLSKTTVTLDASGSTDSDGSIVQYEWDLDGNGTYETDGGSSPTTTTQFLTPGIHTVRLRVTDDTGATDVTSLDIDVGNRPPVADFTAPSPAVTGSPATLDASASGDPDGSVAQYQWDFDNDGTYDATTTSPSIQHSFTQPGTVTVGLRVTDDSGATATVTKPVVVTNAPSAQMLVSPNPVHPSQTVTFSSAGSSDSDGTITSYEWDLDGNGTYEFTGATPPPRSYPLGTYLIKLRVTDNDGATDVKTTSLVVADNPPAPALTVTPSSPVAGQPALFDASGSTDSDGTIVRYEWDLDGDGSYETDTGTVPAASRTYPNHGPVTVHLRITDNDGVTATKALTFNVADPLAAGGGGTGTGGGAGTGGGTGAGTGTGGPTGATPSGPFSAGLVGPAIQFLALAAKRGVGLSCQSDRPARCAVQADVDARSAKRLHLISKRSKRRAPYVVGTATTTATAGHDGVLSLRLTSKARRALGKAGSVALVVRGTATDAQGTTVKLLRGVLLRK